MLNETIHSLLSSNTGPDTPATLNPPTIGKLKKTITGISSPWYITIADDGIAYLTDSHAKKLHKLDSEGKILKTVSFPGSPLGICVKGTQLLVSDYSNNRVVEYNTELTQVGTKINAGWS